MSTIQAREMAKDKREDIVINAVSFIKVRCLVDDQPPTNADHFFGWVGYDRVKNYPHWAKIVYIPDQLPLYPRCIPDAVTLKQIFCHQTFGFYNISVLKQGFDMPFVYVVYLQKINWYSMHILKAVDVIQYF